MTTDKALIFANGDLRNGRMVQRALAHADHALIVAADGGALAARYFGLMPHCIIGDMDSVDPALLADLQKAGVEVRRFPEAKNETDLELALLYAVERGVRWVRVIGAVGGRLDQTLSNVFLLALPALRHCDVRLAAGDEETSLLMPGTLTIEGEAGDTISLLPMSGIARGVRTDGLAYPLNDEDLFLGPARGVSNVMEKERAHVHVREGALLVLHTIGKA